MPVVIDPSAILGLAMEDEAAEFADSVLTAIEAEGGLAPSIFWYELRNVLIVNERRGRITPEQSTTFLTTLAELPVELQDLPNETGVLVLARKHQLSVYDAAYLELATRRGAPLATLDSGLREVAIAIGAQLFSA
jgi:predicted nucleic acid-binding protein